MAKTWILEKSLMASKSSLRLIADSPATHGLCIGQLVLAEDRPRFRPTLS